MPYAQGGAYVSFFEGEANIDFDNHFIVLELEQLNTKKSLQAVVLMLLMYLIDVEMRRGERSQPTCHHRRSLGLNGPRTFF